MTQRLDANAISPSGLKAVLGLHIAVKNSGLERSLLDLVNMRASQLNACAYCLQLHSAEAVARGESHERLHLLPAWREVDAFTPRERAALAWTEAVTHIAHGGVDDALYAAAWAQFDESELVALNYAVITINALNRLAIPFRKAPPVAAPADAH